MLDRVLEPEVMDSPEEARDYDAMDHRAVNQLFVADFLARWNGDNPILDLGTGTAQIPILLCRESPTAEVVASDFARHMLDLAQRNVEKAGLGSRIRLDFGDAKRLSFRDGFFAAVMSNSIIHHIPEPGQVFTEMVRVVQPGGLLFVRDLLRPETGEQLQSLVDTYASDANDHQRGMFADSLHAALTLAEVRSFVTSLGYQAQTVQQTTDRHWTWTTRRSKD